MNFGIIYIMFEKRQYSFRDVYIIKTLKECFLPWVKTKKLYYQIKEQKEKGSKNTLEKKQIKK